MRAQRKLLIGLLCLVVVACAKILPPPGGPEDRTPPSVVSVTPEPGSVNVPRDIEVQAEFSEPVLHERVKDAIYVSPRPEGEISIGGGERRITIQWDDSLAANTTYLLTIAARIPDRRNNQMKSPYVWAFSTASVIDSGTIKGAVYQNGIPVSNTQVFAFSLPLEDDSTLYKDPRYLTETGADGAFTLAYLSPGRFRLLAVKDNNGNRRLDVGETVGVATFDPEITKQKRTPRLVTLHLQAVDTSAFIARRARVNNDRVLVVEFTHPVDSGSWQAADWLIQRKEDSGMLAVHELFLDPDDYSQVIAHTDSGHGGESYQLTIDQVTAESRPLDTTGQTVQFFWPTAADTTAPEVMGIWPADDAEGVRVACTVRVIFSEPVGEPVDDAMRLVDTAGTAITGEIAAVAPWEWWLIPDSRLKPGQEYIIFVDTLGVLDDSGNRLPQVFRSCFTTADPRQMGTISGEIAVSEPNWVEDSLILTFLSTAKPGKKHRTYRPGAGAYKFSLPAGYYVLELVVDHNGNGQFDPGRLQPFIHAEPWFSFPDTVEVRARFEIESVDLTIP